MNFIVGLLLLFVGACVSQNYQPTCEELSDDPVTISQCHQERLNKPIPAPNTDIEQIESQKDQLGLRNLQTNCTGLAIKDLLLLPNCHNSWSIQIEVQCLIDIAGNAYPKALAGKNMQWVFGKQSGTSTTNQDGRFVINVSRQNIDSIDNKKLKLSYNESSFVLGRDQMSRPLILKKDQCL